MSEAVLNEQPKIGITIEIVEKKMDVEIKKEIENVSSPKITETGEETVIPTVVEKKSQNKSTSPIRSRNISPRKSHPSQKKNSSSPPLSPKKKKGMQWALEKLEKYKNYEQNIKELWQYDNFVRCVCVIIETKNNLESSKKILQTQINSKIGFFIGLVNFIR